MIRAACLLMLIVLTCAAPAAARERPRYGGGLVLTVPSEPPSYDGHREGTFATIHTLAPVPGLASGYPLDYSGQWTPVK